MMRRIQREKIKRLFDLVGATLTMVLLLPVVFVIALVIKLEGRGPVLFRQERLGRGRRPFQIFKFRTMKVDAEKGTGPVWATEGDSRATPVGRVLRSTHLDEIPQLWNVVRGEMSLVGPRPERGHFVAQFEPLVPRYADRFAACPGITGLSQIRSGYDQSIRTVRRKIRYDRFYTRRACLLLDVWLLSRTVGHVLHIGSGQASSRRFGRSDSRWRIPVLFPFGARARRLAGFLAFGAFAAASASSSASSSSSFQASPGSPHPRGGTDRPDPRESPPATGRTEFPWPGGAARLYESVGLDPQLVLDPDPRSHRGLKPGLGKEKGKGKRKDQKDGWPVFEEPASSWPVIEEPKNAWPVIEEPENALPVTEVPAVESKAIEESGPSQVPEPPSLLLVAGGLALLRRNRRPLLRE